MATRYNILIVEEDADEARKLEASIAGAPLGMPEIYARHVTSVGDARLSLAGANLDAVLINADLARPTAEDSETFHDLKMAARGAGIVVYQSGNAGPNSDYIRSLLLEAGAVDALGREALESDILRRSLMYACEYGFTRAVYAESGGFKDSRDILLIEDDEDQRKLMETALRKHGYLVYCAETAETGLEMAADIMPSIILCDLHLPGMDGVSACEAVRNNPRLEATPFMILSAEQDEKTILRALAAGVDEFLHKPVRTAVLNVRMGGLLKLRRKERDMVLLNRKLEKEKGILAKYFSYEFVEHALSEKISPNLGGNIQEATMMFFDIRGSTTIAERVAPSEFSEFLSQLFTDLMDMIFSNGGSVNKMLGDGILATFGCPIPGDHDARNAVKTALDIRNYMGTYNTVRPDFLSDPVGYGLGIATGSVFSGNIGSYRRMEYTVLGDPVNLASRLESMTKKAGVDVLMDGRTREILGQSVKVKKVQHNQVRGKLQNVEIYHPVSIDLTAAV